MTELDHTEAAVDLGQSATRLNKAAAKLMGYAVQSRAWERHRAEIADQIAEIRNALQPLVSWCELFELESLQRESDAHTDDQESGRGAK